LHDRSDANQERSGTLHAGFDVLARNEAARNIFVTISPLNWKSDPIGAVFERGNVRDREGLINIAGMRVMADPTPMTSSQQCSRNLSV
jgi:hypothetical protein